MSEDSGEVAKSHQETWRKLVFVKLLQETSTTHTFSINNLQGDSMTCDYCSVCEKALVRSILRIYQRLSLLVLSVWFQKRISPPCRDMREHIQPRVNPASKTGSHTHAVFLPKALIHPPNRGHHSTQIKLTTLHCGCLPTSTFI